jgi:hypothetical protein
MSRDSERQVESDDFRNFYIATRNIDKKILANAKRELKKAAQPAALEAKKAVLAIPSEAHHHLEGAPRPRLSLRASIAACIKVGFKSTKKMAGVVIRVDAKQFAKISEAGGRTGNKIGKLPRYVDGRIKRWKHPVFGQNMDKPEHWPVQKTHPFLRKAVEKHKTEFVDAMAKAVDTALKDIKNKGLH